MMLSFEKEMFVLQSLSMTWERVWKASFLKPRALISFHTCSIENFWSWLKSRLRKVLPYFESFDDAWMDCFLVWLVYELAD